MKKKQLLALTAMTIAATYLEISHEAKAIVPGMATYNYDSVGRLVQDTYPTNSEAYAYDAGGNRLTSVQN